jgi:hypothetical protein
MEKYKKYHIGQIVKNIVPVKRESGQIIKAGTLLRIVSIAPKVRMNKLKDSYNDSLPYFYNAVPENESDRNRIREDFCTIKII